MVILPYIPFFLRHLLILCLAVCFNQQAFDLMILLLIPEYLLHNLILISVGDLTIALSILLKMLFPRLSLI